MTGWSVVVARTAERDLAEAVLYIKDRLGNQAAALRLLDEFESIVADIANNPEARPLVRNARIARLGYRWAPVGNYMAFYVADRTSKTVTVERLLYGRSNWSDAL